MDSGFANLPIWAVVYSPKVSTWGTFVVIHGSQGGEKFESPDEQFSSRGWTGDCLLLVSALCQWVSFCTLFSDIFHIFLCFLLVILLCKMASKWSAEVRSSVPECKLTETCLWRKYVCWISSVQTWLSCWVEFNGNESTICIIVTLNRNAHNSFMYWCDQRLRETWPAVG